jgi:hypothetical protein
VRTLARRTLTILSLLLLVGTVGMWVRAQWACDTLNYRRTFRPGGEIAQGQARLDAHRGAFQVILGLDTFQRYNAVQRDNLERDLPSDDGFSRRTSAPISKGFADAGRGRFGFACRSYDSAVDTQGFTIQRRVGGREYSAREWAVALAIPWWFLTLLFAIAPALAVRRWHRSRRRQPHQCRACGYDLRATADPAGPLLATCPECGRPAVTSAATS